MPTGQFIYDFSLNQRRIHIETDQPPHSTVHIVALERAIHRHLARQLQQLSLHLFAVFRCTSKRELYAGTRFLHGLFNTLTSAHPSYRINIQTLLYYNLRHGTYLPSLKTPAQYGQYIAVLSLPANPSLILLQCYRGKLYIHSQLAGLEKQFFHYLSTTLLINPDEYTKTQCCMNHSLTYILDMNIMNGEYLHYFGN